VIEGREVERGRLAVRTQGDEVVLAALGHAVDHDVLDLRQGQVSGCFGLGHRVLRRFDALAEFLGLGHERGLLVLRRLRDAFAVRVLRGAQLFEGRDGGAPFAIGLHRRIHRLGRLPAGDLGALDELGIFTQEGHVDHASILESPSRAPTPRAPRARAFTNCPHWAPKAGRS
jgi:hypothetical protein